MQWYPSAWIKGLRYVVRYELDWWDENTIGSYRSEKALLKLIEKKIVQTEKILGRRPGFGFRIDTFKIGG